MQETLRRLLLPIVCIPASKHAVQNFSIPGYVHRSAISYSAAKPLKRAWAAAFHDHSRLALLLNTSNGQMHSNTQSPIQDAQL